KAEHATERAMRQAYRHYKTGARSDAAKLFRKRFSHDDVQIEAVAVWDTVKALGLRMPIVWRWAQAQHAYHNHRLGDHVRNGFHALALHETREAYAPVMWDAPPNWEGHIEQVWFRGTHADVGGQVTEFPAARPLANIPLVWMLTKLEACGLDLPDRWQDRFPQNPDAPSIGGWRGWSKLFLSRRRRIILASPSESVHPTAMPD
ncbi:MAG: hypothetical protein ACI91Z_001353, partial [Yoonia sp.]